MSNAIEKQNVTKTGELLPHGKAFLMNPVTDDAGRIKVTKKGLPKYTLEQTFKAVQYEELPAEQQEALRTAVAKAMTEDEAKRGKIYSAVEYCYVADETSGVSMTQKELEAWTEANGKKIDQPMWSKVMRAVALAKMNGIDFEAFKKKYVEGSEAKGVTAFLKESGTHSTGAAAKQGLEAAPKEGAGGDTQNDADPTETKEVSLNWQSMQVFLNACTDYARDHVRLEVEPRTLCHIASAAVELASVCSWGLKAGQWDEDSVGRIQAAIGALQKGMQSERPLAHDINASPAAIKFAKEIGVDLSSVEGSGKEGLITKRDVLQAAKQAA